MTEKVGQFRKLVAQFLSYAAVGGTAFVVDFGMLYLLTEHFGIHYIVSATAGFLAGLIVNYVLCIWLIFEFRAIGKTSYEFGLFTAIGVAGLLLNNTLIWSLTELASFHYLTSKLIVAIVVLLFNFTLRRQLLFSNNRLADHLASRTFAKSN